MSLLSDGKTFWIVFIPSRICRFWHRSPLFKERSTDTPKTLYLCIPVIHLQQPTSVSSNPYCATGIKACEKKVCCELMGNPWTPSSHPWLPKNLLEKHNTNVGGKELFSSSLSSMDFSVGPLERRTKKCLATGFLLPVWNDPCQELPEVSGVKEGKFPFSSLNGPQFLLLFSRSLGRARQSVSHLLYFCRSL